MLLLMLLTQALLLLLPSPVPALPPSPPPPPPACPSQERFPEYAFPEGEASEPAELINNSRVQAELGLALTPVKETLTDMAATLIQLGLAQPQPRKGSQCGGCVRCRQQQPVSQCMSEDPSQGLGILLRGALPL